MSKGETSVKLGKPKGKASGGLIVEVLGKIGMIKLLIILTLLYQIGLTQAHTGTSIVATEGHMKRNMAVLWRDGESSKSDVNTKLKCKTDCIDQGKVFCIDELSSKPGVCCDNSENCAQTKDSTCSSDTDSIGLAYMTCPREPGLCGSEIISVSGT